MNSSEIEQSTATVELEEPPGSRYTSSPTLNLPVLESPVARRPVVRDAPPRSAAEDRNATESVPYSATRRRAVSTRTRAFRRAFFRDVPDKDWNDWRWQSRHRVRKLEQIERMLVLSDDEREALIKGESMLPVGITPYYMSLLDREDATQPLRRTVIPV